MKVRFGLGFALVLALGFTSGCKMQLQEALTKQIQAIHPGGGSSTPTPTTPPIQPQPTWTTYSASSGVTNYRALGTVSNVNYGFIEYLPSNYNSAPSGYFPLVIFLHGIGERGDGSVASLTSYRNNTGNAAGVQYNIDHGKYYNAVVLTPQCPGGGWWSGGEVDKVVNYAIANYKVDPKRILITGLSMGGGGTWDYISGYPSKVAAAVPICGASGCSAATAQLIPQNVKIWAFHAIDDTTVYFDSNAVPCMNQVGSALGQVGSFKDNYNSALGDQTAHFSNSTKRWVFESEIDCKDPAGNPWSPQVCMTVFQSGNHFIWGRVYQQATDAPMIWLLNQKRP